MPPSRDDELEDTLDEALRHKARIEELSDSDFEDVDDHEDANGGPPFPGQGHFNAYKPSNGLPPWLDPANFNLFHDDLVTTTSEARAKTLAECLPLLAGEDNAGLPLNSHGLPHLRREAHIKFLHNTLGPLPAPFQVVDASRPWLFYWALAGLSFLGEDVRQYKDRLVGTLRPLQNATGGFGGGHGQYSHCAGTYASVLALALVDGLEMIDRKAMWQWLGQMKQSDGGFTMAQGAEEDIRGAYCAMTIITFLNLPLDLPSEAPARRSGLTSFTDRLGEWVGRCQTYEGGIAGAPTNEAHGAYAFCALACLSILDQPRKSIPTYLDVQALVRWLASVQTSPEGGFAGRTNKLVDACYSHWVGGCWALVQAAVSDDEDTSDLWSRKGLIRYLLCCCQQPGKKGGMRDKPSTKPDGYHTCYSLAGLSAAQNHYTYSPPSTSLLEKAKATFGGKEGESEGEKAKQGRLTAAFEWKANKMKAYLFDDDDRVGFVHPVFVVPFEVVDRVQKQFMDVGI